MDDFREWLSDNLRYFMLGGAVLIIVVVLFFGVRACVGSKKGNSTDNQTTAANEDQGNDPSSPTNEGETDEKKESANPMETAGAEITALIKSYYEALGEKDIATLKTLEDDLTPSDESKITNATEYIEGYEVGEVYTREGMTDNSYVVYARFYYICQGITTKVPALSRLYVYAGSDGKYIIDNDAETDTKISAYMEAQTSDDDVKELISEVKQDYEKVQESDPALAEFLAGLGEDASVSTAAQDGTMLTVTEDCNVRAGADGEAEVIGGLSAGTQVEKKGAEGEWIQIEYEGETAYVHSSLLTEN